MFTSKTRQRHGNNYKVIECNRVSEYTTQYCFFKDFESTFSTNASIILTELVFESLRIRHEGIWRDDLKHHLDIEITITKISNQGFCRKKQLLAKETARLQCGSNTVVTLSESILARPGHEYEIKLTHSSNEHSYNVPVLKTTVQLDPNIIIQFHNDPTTARTKIPTSPIIALRFARIDA